MNEAKCPLCGSEPTRFQHPYSDQFIVLPFDQQRCQICDLPCKHWRQIADLFVALQASTKLLMALQHSQCPSLLANRLQKQLAANEAELKKARKVNG